MKLYELYALCESFKRQGDNYGVETTQWLIARRIVFIGSRP